MIGLQSKKVDLKIMLFSGALRQQKIREDVTFVKWVSPAPGNLRDEVQKMESTFGTT